MPAVIGNGTKIAKRPVSGQFRLTLLLLAYVAMSCVSLVLVMQIYEYVGTFAYDRSKLFAAFLTVTPAIAISFLFAISRFSFGYLVGFGLYGTILGYLWLNSFSHLNYDHWLGTWSALAALICFLLPALFITSPIRQRFTLSKTAFDRLLVAILILGAAVIAIGASYNFRFVGLADMYQYRGTLQLPRPLAYADGIFSNALLPFAFAAYAVRGDRLKALTALVLMSLFFPIVLTKLAFAAPIWLLYLAVLARMFEIRTATVLSFFSVLTLGVLLQPLRTMGVLSNDAFISYFGTINFRMLAVPSIVLDMYSAFFSNHPPTYFCQMSYLKPFVACPYAEPLQVVMFNNFSLGYANASLFGNEGVASLGLTWAPLSALVCGLIIAFANRVSAGLPPKFILLSGAIIAQVLMNVPLATSMLSNGTAFLLLLWYVTPRSLVDATLTPQTDAS